MTLDQEIHTYFEFREIAATSAVKVRIQALWPLRHNGRASELRTLLQLAKMER